MTIIVYTLTDCPNCETLKERLTAMGYEFTERPMDDPEALTEMRVGGCFSKEAPVLQIDGQYHTYADIRNGLLLPTLFRDIEKKEIDLHSITNAEPDQVRSPTDELTMKLAITMRELQAEDLHPTHIIMDDETYLELVKAAAPHLWDRVIEMASRLHSSYTKFMGLRVIIMPLVPHVRYCEIVDMDAIRENSDFTGYRRLL